jgi:hypothetical protein
MAALYQALAVQTTQAGRRKRRYADKNAAAGAIAFSSEVGAGWREENASKQQAGASALIPSKPKRY